MEKKQTAKREYQFVIFPARKVVEIVDKDKNVLRTFDITELGDEVQAILPVHGLKQKLTDDTMVSKIGEDADRLLALDDLWAQLVAGEWEKERQGVARPPEALIRLVIELKKVSRVVAEASLKEAGKAKWDAIKAAHAKRVEEIEKKIKEEKAGASAIDLTDL